jgi:predicted Zn finger-like uncharacterized protein
MIITITCPHCGYSKRVIKEKIPTGIRWIRCSRCNQRFELSHEMGFKQKWDGASSDDDQKRVPSPWEMRSELGIWKGIYKTAKNVLLRPDHFFRGLAFKEGSKEPLAFGVLFGSVGAMLGLFWNMIFFSGTMALSGLGFLGGMGASLIFLLIFLILPIFIAIKLIITSSIIHLSLMVFRASSSGLEGTLRVISFSMAVQIIGLVPLVGGFISGLYTMIVQIIGIKEIHNTSYARTIAGYLMPVVITIVVVIWLMMKYLSRFM